MKFPITVTGIKFDERRTYEPKALFGGECGQFVSIRPCAPEHNGKTFLGILLGEIASTQACQLAKNGELTVSNTMHNPAIFVPDLNKVVFGFESWWGKIKKPEDLEQITDADISNVWYVKALEQLTSKEQEPVS